MNDVLAWCGAPPLPWELWGRWTLDPALFAGLALAALTLTRATRGVPVGRRRAGWAGLGVTGAVFITPLCALAVALFSARAAQHMVLVLVAAPLIAMALPPPARRGAALLTAAFTALFWLWHLPGPYDAALRDGALYWLSHLSLLGIAIALWRALLADASPGSLALGAVASAQMGLLGAVIVFAPGALYASHLGTTAVFGLSALADQQLGGLLMWVPGGLVFLLVGVAGALRLVRPAA
ncbi:cytochrome c oxidase assembly protein [Roseomonas stagni]|uniref:Cytochrome c oxidase assembly protein n=1 Tax=Falsiroseomonas algicola TaxID=2716930 RepID=A0A6M1LIL6_9PROT|nr:cytochrome c oxidase assembly protein [Falsiroseomonas algicola]NGM20091.1 cytochrome c oxidase assembly protein [Falsiroseomonas algicola]